MTPSAVDADPSGLHHPAVFALEPRHFYPRDEGAKELATSRRGMLQLAERYDIKGKSVVSFGAGKGHVEYWLLSQGNRLVLVDEDTSGRSVLTRRLNMLGTRHEAAPQSMPLTYVPGGLSQTNWLTPTYDVVVLSGAIVADAGLRDDLLRDSGLARSLRAASPELVRAVLSAVPWPRDGRVRALRQAGLDLAVRAVNDHGLVVIKRTIDGPPLPDMAGYLAATARELEAVGLYLVDAYYAQARPTQHVFVAMRHSGPAVEEMASKIRGRTSLVELSLEGDRAQALVPLGQADIKAAMDALDDETESPNVGDSPQQTLMKRGELWTEFLTRNDPKSAPTARPIADALDRFALQPDRAIVIGPRAEWICAMLTQRAVAVAFATNETEDDGTVHPDVAISAVSGWRPILEAEPLAAGLIVLSTSTREERDRLKHNVAWRRRIEVEGVEPGDPPPFLGADVQTLISRHLADQGTLILEVHTGDIDLRRYPAVWTRLQSELEAMGLHPLELHALRSTPGLILLIAQKTNQATATATAEAARAQKPLQYAHTYSHTRPRTMPLWSAVEPQLAPPPLGKRAWLKRLIGRT